MRSRRRSAIALVALAAVAVALVVAALMVFGSSGGSESPVTVRSNSLVLIKPEGTRVVDAISLEATPTRLAYGDGAFWIVMPSGGKVVRVDEDSRSVETFQVGEEPYDVSVGGAAVWVPDHDLQRLLRLDPESGDVQESKDFGAPAVAAAYAFDAVWVVVVPGVLMRLDPDTLKSTKTVGGVAETTELAEPKLVFAGDALWIAGPSNGVVTRIGRRGDRQTRDLPGVTSIAVEGGTVWVGSDEGYVARLDVGEPAPVRVGDIPVDIATKDGELWVAAYERAVKRLDPARGRSVATIKLPDRPVAVAAGEKLIAVAVGESPF